MGDYAVVLKLDDATVPDMDLSFAMTAWQTLLDEVRSGYGEHAGLHRTIIEQVTRVLSAEAGERVDLRIAAEAAELDGLTANDFGDNL